MDLLALRSERAIVSAARELGVDALALADALQNGRLAQLILELRLAERRATGPGRERLMKLLEELPDGSGAGAPPAKST
jgi:hypothetical protein